MSCPPARLLVKRSTFCGHVTMHRVRKAATPEISNQRLKRGIKVRRVLFFVFHCHCHMTKSGSKNESCVHGLCPSRQIADCLLTQRHRLAGCRAFWFWCPMQLAAQRAKTKQIFRYLHHSLLVLRLPPSFRADPSLRWSSHYCVVYAASWILTARSSVRAP